ncbi:PepSY-associated TM helix domain-containing protein [Sinomicrobium weinanense]|uniref:PepSY domain-containing protein n=1 Tax=Sinomicrobium weinanense TaxID=2842200 RepID=A0A926Q2T5_9FLAO|nr:PepSY-associated TM helix domain-containing protein [Sinomicrobium weinanense]MBC9795281.1 PepSY domain-containing protein [Sinomicrobium weinanense]MBU3125753.1 PepSY domain-containing protein [Sinomicrobium weinanense]
MNNRALLKYHSIFGIIAGSFLFIIGLTGSVLVFNEEIDAAIFKKYEARGYPEAFNLDAAVANVQKEYPEWNTRIIHLKKGETFVFNLRRPEARKLVFAHPGSGEITGEIDEHTHVTKWLLKLHYALHAGIIGRILVLVTGILFLFSIITGIVLYRKVFFRTLLFRTKIKKNNKQAYYSGLHRYVGVWALLLNLVLVITGIFLGYKVVQAGFKKASEPHPPQLAISLETALGRLTEEHPDFKAEYIRLPSNETSGVVINGLFNDDPFYYSMHYNKIQLNYKTGKEEKVVKIADKPLSYRLDSMITPLHFGQFAGIFGKILYAIVGLSGPFLSITGFVIWRLRLKKKKKK